MKKHYVFLLGICLFVAISVIADGPLNGGDPNCDGTNDISDLTYYVDFMFGGGAEPCAITGAPIAYGFVNFDGSLASSYNVTSSEWDGIRYEITIAGENYYWLNYVTVVTASNSTPPRIAQTGSSSGELNVYLYEPDGSYTQGAFQFVTYKP